jgi:predicted membrane-bound dolichyl-phosphate-mannose-protein mannosyltransferase
MQIDSSTAFFSMVIVLVFGNHSLFRVYAVQILKVRAVILQHFAKYLRFHLLQKLIKRVSIDKEAFA